MTTLAQPILLWSFLALPILLLVHFGADLFGTNFTKIIFSFAFYNFFSFLVYFFSKAMEDFLFIFTKISFHST